MATNNWGSVILVLLGNNSS